MYTVYQFLFSLFITNSDDCFSSFITKIFNINLIIIPDHEKLMKLISLYYIEYVTGQKHMIHSKLIYLSL